MAKLQKDALQSGYRISHEVSYIKHRVQDKVLFAVRGIKCLGHIQTQVPCVGFEMVPETAEEIMSTFTGVERANIR